MGYRQSNAAFAYDMQPVATPAGYDRQAPRPAERPRLRVVTGEGREADQAVSPAFLCVVKVLCSLALLFCVVGLARVALSSVTAATLNSNADLAEALQEGRDESSDLEVMHSVYASPTRIRDLAAGTLGMVEGTDSVTLDMSSDAAPAADADGAPSGSEADSAATASAQNAR